MSKASPFFSVIVPAYNAEKYIFRCVDSILSQTFTDFELIIVNDASKDNTLQICQKNFSDDSRVKLINLSENGGVVNARDIGIKNSVGQYICWVDADDYIDSHRLKTFYDTISEYDVDIVLSGWTLDKPNKKSKIKDAIPAGVYKGDDYNIIRQNFFRFNKSKFNRNVSPNVWSKAARKSLYMHTLDVIDRNLKIGDDTPRTVVAFYKASSLAVIDDCSYHYVVQENQMTRSYYRDYYIQSSRLYDLISDILRKDNEVFDFDATIKENLSHISCYGVISTVATYSKNEVLPEIQKICNDFKARGLDKISYGFEWFYFRWMLRCIRNDNFKMLLFLARVYLKLA